MGERASDERTPAAPSDRPRSRRFDAAPRVHPPHGRAGHRCASGVDDAGAPWRRAGAGVPVRLQGHQARRRRRAQGAAVARARRCSIRTSPTAPKTSSARGLFYEPLAASTTKARPSRCWPPRCRRRANGGVARRRPVGHLEAQARRHLARRRAVHRRRRGVQLGIRCATPTAAAFTLGAYANDEGDREDRCHTVRVVFYKPTPLWSDAFVGDCGDAGKHCSRRTRARKLARGAGQPEAGGHRPVSLRRLQARRSGARRAQPELPHAEPAVLRHHRDQGRRRCRPRRRARCCRPASIDSRGTCWSKTTCSSAWRTRQGPRAASTPPPAATRVHPAQRRRSEDRDRRRARAARSRAIRCCASPRCATALGAAARPARHPGVRVRSRGHRLAQHPEQPGAAQQPQPHGRVQRRQGQRGARRRRLEARQRRRAREGRPQAQAAVPDLDQLGAPEGAGDLQAGRAKGRHRVGAQGGHGVGVLLVRHGQPRHQRQVLGRSADVRLHARSPDPDRYMQLWCRGRCRARPTSGRA